MGKFQPGESGNKAGKPKGSKNKIQASAKQMIHDIIIGYHDRFEDGIQKLKPYEFCRVYIELLSYELPKMRSVEVDIESLNLLPENQARQLYSETAKQILLKVYGDRLPDEIKQQYG